IYPKHVFFICVSPLTTHLNMLIMYLFKILFDYISVRSHSHFPSPDHPGRVNKVFCSFALRGFYTRFFHHERQRERESLAASMLRLRLLHTRRGLLAKLE